MLINIDLDIYEGNFTVIMGSSGSGKSTLLQQRVAIARALIGWSGKGDWK